jgi:hypothetical protein
MSSTKIRFKRGYHLVNVDNFSYNESVNLILMISNKKYYFEIKEDNFDQIEFLKFIIRAIRVDFLKRGNILVMDNCSIHKGKEIRPILRYVLTKNRITVLPKFLLRLAI